MLKNLKRKFAKTALVVLALQLAFMGVGTGATSAVAAAGDYTLTATGDIGNFNLLENKTFDGANNVLADVSGTPIQDSSYFSAKDYSPIYVTLNKVAEALDYTGGVRISSMEVPGIQVWAPDALGNWYDVNEIGYGAPGGDLASNYLNTPIPVYVVSSTEQTLSIPLQLADVVDQSVIATTTIEASIVNPYSLTSDGAKINVTTTLEGKTFDGANNVLADSLKQPIKNINYFSEKGYAPILVTLSQTDETPDYKGVVRVSATNISGIQIWAPDALGNWYDVNESGYGEKAGSLASNFLDTPIPVYIVSATEQSLAIPLNLVNVLDQSVLATTTVKADGISPVATIAAKSPTNLKTIPVSVVFSEPVIGFDLSKLTLTGGTVGNLVGGLSNYTFDVTPADVSKVQDITIDLLAGLVHDAAGNANLASSQLKIHFDPEVPSAITGLTTTVNPDGTVTLDWTLPEGTFDGFTIMRDGVAIATLKPNQTTFTDNTTVKGQTYTYSVVTFDLAGNKNTTLPLSVNVPAPVVAAAVSDSVAYAPTDSTNTNTDVAVKAEVTGDDSAKTEDKSGFPIWGIILLVILALVGGYLIWNQKPALEPIVTVETKKNNTKKK